MGGSTNGGTQGPIAIENRKGKAIAIRTIGRIVAIGGGDAIHCGPFDRRGRSTVVG